MGGAFDAMVDTSGPTSRPMDSSVTSTAPAQSAAVCGNGTGFGVREDVWTRELTDDGRVYYFNRATGASQWHLPDQLSDQGLTVFPTHAKAMLRVDCITELAAGRNAADTTPKHTAQGPSLQGRAAIESLELDPHSTDKIMSVVPQEIGDVLRSEEFKQACEACFKSVAEEPNGLFLEDIGVTLLDLFNALKMSYLMPKGPRISQLANLFNTSGAPALSLQDFLAFTRFVVAVSYLELDADE